MRSAFRCHILLVLHLLLLVACDTKGPNDFSGADVQSIPTEWKPDDVNFTCASPPCPESVGLLIATTTTRTKSGDSVIRSQSAKICSGAIAESKNLILTNGHCNPFRADNGSKSPSLWQRKMFITVNAAGKPSQIYDIDRELFHVHDPTTTTGPDVAVLELTNSVWDREPLKVARTYNSNLKDFVTFVVNQQKTPKGLGREFRLTKNTCVARPEIAFPFLDSEKVNLMIGYDCVLRHGNSGSPFFSSTDLTTIEGVVQAVSNPLAIQESIDTRRKEIGEQKFLLEAQKWNKYLEHSRKAPARAIGTRLACLSIPAFGGSRENCLSYDSEIQKRNR